MKLSVVVPVYNERDTIEPLLERIQTVPIQKEIIIVDDCSTDGTKEFLEVLTQSAQSLAGSSVAGRLSRGARNATIKVIFHKKNLGKGAALRSGFRMSTGEIVVVQDADLEYDPEEYPKLLEPIATGAADIVYGSRFLNGRPRRMPLWSYLGNRTLTVVSNLLSRLQLSDAWTGYKVFRREVLQRMDLQEDRFSFESEVTAKAARAGWRIQEIPVSYQRRSYSEGKKIGWQDWLEALWSTVHYNVRRFLP